MCPRSIVTILYSNLPSVQEVVTHFYVCSYYIKWVTSSWTHGTIRWVTKEIQAEEIMTEDEINIDYSIVIKTLRLKLKVRIHT